MSESPSSDAKRQKTSHSTGASKEIPSTPLEEIPSTPPEEIPSTPPEERPPSPKKVLILFMYFCTDGMLYGDTTSLVEVELPEGIKPEKEVWLSSERDMDADTEKSVLFWELVRLSIDRDGPEQYQDFAKHIPEGFVEIAATARKIPNEGPGMPATDGSVVFVSYA